MKTQSATLTFGSFNKQRLWLMGGMLLMVLIISACSDGNRGSASTVSDGAGSNAASAATISIGELPEGLGRGLPEAALQSDEPTAVGVQSGDLPPNFQLTLDDGSNLSLRDLQGQPVMINFWATWCGPCRIEMPDIVEKSEEHEDLVVLAVNVGEDRDAVQSFVEEFEMSMTVARDVESTLRKAYEVRGMPTSVFIDKEGNVSTVWSGFLTADKLQELLDEIL